MKSEKIIDEFFLSYMPTGGRVGDIRENRLARMEKLLHKLSHPEKDMKLIHVAGSKGKGSMTSLLSLLIEKSGEKTGTYMSPHVYSLFERFSCSGTFFSEDDYISAYEELKEKIEDLSFSPTTFELYTAYAYLLFRNTCCSYAVIETGLGGRLDATNTIMPLFSVIMPIEKEHTQILGKSIAKIAYEKAGIIKKGKRVYIAKNPKSALRVFEKRAEELGCELVTYSDLVKSVRTKEGCDKDNVHILFTDGSSCNLKTSLRGKAMAENIAFSLAIAKHEGLSCLDEDSLSAVESFTIPGRFEERKINGKAIILDVAHTVNSARNFKRTFSSIYSNRKGKKVLLFSSLEEKAHEKMLSIISECFDEIIITRSGIYKKSDPYTLYEEAIKTKDKEHVHLYADENEAFDKALALGDIIAVVGSFYLLGAIKELGNA